VKQAAITVTVVLMLPCLALGFVAALAWSFTAAGWELARDFYAWASP
jgi:hypothetical protein